VTRNGGQNADRSPPGLDFCHRRRPLSKTRPRPFQEATETNVRPLEPPFCGLAGDAAAVQVGQPDPLVLEACRRTRSTSALPRSTARRWFALVPLSSGQDSGWRATLRSSAAQIDAPGYRAAGPSCPTPKAGRCNDGSQAPFPHRPERRHRLVPAAIEAIGAPRLCSCVGSRTAIGLAAAPGARQTGEGGQCLLTDTNSCL
jgi:hypothetical protein